MVQMLIDMSKLLKELRELCRWHAENAGEFSILQRAIRIVYEQPTVDAEPVRHGKWITEECLPGVAVCSICGHEIRGIGCQYTKYCDECGARMDKE